MADDPEKLTFTESVRKRPGMYVGETSDGSGLHHLLYELVANALDQHLMGRVTQVRVECCGRVLTVDDDGPGLATDKTQLASMFLRWHDAPTRDGHLPHVHFGNTLRGFGLAVVAALTSRLDVATRGPGGALSAVFSRGKLQDEAGRLEVPAGSGTTLRLEPDDEVFGPDAAFDLALVHEQLQWLAYLNPGLQVLLNDTELTARDGLTDACVALSGAERSDVIAIRAVLENVLVDIALVWCGEEAPEVVSYVSQMRSLNDGTHVAGMWIGLRRALTAVAVEDELVGLSAASFRDVAGRGLTAVVHAGMYHPSYGSPTKDLLVSEEARTAFADAVCAGLSAEFLVRPVLRRVLLSRFEP